MGSTKIEDVLSDSNKFSAKVISTIENKFHELEQHVLDCLAVAFIAGMFYQSRFYLFWLAVALFFTPLCPFLLVYLLWMYFDKETPFKDGRRIELFRSEKMYNHFRKYFPISIIKTADINPTKNYIFSLHPHGLLCLGGHGAFIGQNSEFDKLYPGITVHGHTLDSNFYFPFSREYFLAAGYRSVSKRSLNYTLTKGTGNASLIVVGGSSEVFLSEPQVHKIILNNRKGFVKLAITTGADLVPIYMFGENELYHHYTFPENHILRKIQEAARSFTGVAFPMFSGRGVFQNVFGPLPFKKPINVVVGKPIPVEKKENPTEEEVEALHENYKNELTNLFDQHKSDYISEPESTVLQIV